MALNREHTTVGLLDGARANLRRQERDRIEDFREKAGKHLFGILRILEAEPKNPRPPMDDDLALDREWLFGGLLVDVELLYGQQDAFDPLVRMYYRFEGDDLRLYLVGPCRRCDAFTPLEPTIDPRDAYVTFAQAEHLRAPVSGHVCLPRWPTDG